MSVTIQQKYYKLKLIYFICQVQIKYLTYVISYVNIKMRTKILLYINYKRKQTFFISVVVCIMLSHKHYLDFFKNSFTDAS